MNIVKALKYRSVTILTFLIFIINPAGMIKAQQRISIGVHADPLISWFSSDNSEIKNQGARPGFNFGLTINKYFAPNYSFSTGISLLHAGGRLVSSDTTIMEFANVKYKSVTVLPDNAVVYKIQYLTIPIGLKLQTNQIGYITFFTDLGLDPKVVIRGKADIPSHSISNENAMTELKLFNLSYHIGAGIDYALGGNNALEFGLNFENNFLDITKDNVNQPVDIVSHKILSFRFGIIF